LRNGVHHANAVVWEPVTTTTKTSDVAADDVARSLEREMHAMRAEYDALLRRMGGGDGGGDGGDVDVAATATHPKEWADAATRAAVLAERMEAKGAQILQLARSTGRGLGSLAPR